AFQQVVAAAEAPIKTRPRHAKPFAEVEHGDGADPSSSQEHERKVEPVVARRPGDARRRERGHPRIALPSRPTTWTASSVPTAALSGATSAMARLLRIVWPYPPEVTNPILRPFRQTGS